LNQLIKTNESMATQEPGKAMANNLAPDKSKNNDQSEGTTVRRENDDKELLPEDEKKDLEKNSGDLEDGHNDLDEPDSERGVANLE
jgi:hypothetical protein